MNWYNYVSGDPVNGVDPSGMFGMDEPDDKLDSEDFRTSRRTIPPSCVGPQPGPHCSSYLDSPNGLKCLGDVVWGGAKDTVVGSVLALGASAVAEPELKYSGNNASGRKIPRSKGQYLKILAKKVVSKAGLVGAAVGFVWGAGEAYVNSKSCPALL